MLWLGIAVLTVITIAVLVTPMLFGARKHSEVTRQDYDAAVYRDQLAEVDRDVARGLISDADAETAKVEIQRRLLTAVDLETTRTKPEETGRNIVAPAVSLMIPVAALILYLVIGSPQVRDFPYASRTDLAEAAMAEGTMPPDMDEAAAKLEARLMANPDDPDGWMMLGRTYFTMERYADAQRAFLRLYDVTGDIQAKAEYAEALIMGNDAQIGPEALEIFQAVLKADPLDPKARFYFGVAAAQQGKLEDAMQIWTDLLYLSPADAPWIDIVQQQIQQAASGSGIDPATIQPTDLAVKLAESAGMQPGNPVVSAEPGPGPSQNDIENAQKMTADEQQEMIRAMVQRLADRLAADPSDHEGWLKLAQAYEVLGETEKAEDARRHAAETAP